MAADKRYLTRKEAASYLKTLGLPCSPSTLANWAWKKEGPACYRLHGNLLFYTREDIDAWVRRALVKVIANPAARHPSER